MAFHLGWSLMSCKGYPDSPELVTSSTSSSENWWPRPESCHLGGWSSWAVEIGLMTLPPPIFSCLLFQWSDLNSVCLFRDLGPLSKNNDLHGAFCQTINSAFLCVCFKTVNFALVFVSLFVHLTYNRNDWSWANSLFITPISQEVSSAHLASKEKCEANAFWPLYFTRS